MKSLKTKDVGETIRLTKINFDKHRNTILKRVISTLAVYPPNHWFSIEDVVASLDVDCSATAHARLTEFIRKALNNWNWAHARKPNFDKYVRGNPSKRPAKDNTVIDAHGNSVSAPFSWPDYIRSTSGNVIDLATYTRSRS